MNINFKQIAITLAIVFGVQAGNWYTTKDNNKLDGLECSTHVMKASPSIVTVCEKDGDFKRFVTPIKIKEN